MQNFSIEERLMGEFATGKLTLSELLACWISHKYDKQPEPSNTDREYQTGNLAFGTASNTDRKTFPEGILSIKESMFNTIYIYQKDMDYQNWCSGYLSENTNFKNAIHSVKNSNGEVFTVGDDALFSPDNPTVYTSKHTFKIIGFRIGYENKIVAFEDARNTFTVDLLTKVKPKEVLFTSNDGHLVYEDDDYYQITNDGDGFGKNSAQPPAMFYAVNSAIRFKEKANAQRYIDEHRKSISYGEYANYIASICGIDADIKIMMMNNFKPKK